MFAWSGLLTTSSSATPGLSFRVVTQPISDSGVFCAEKIVLIGRNLADAGDVWLGRRGPDDLPFADVFESCKLMSPSQDHDLICVLQAHVAQPGIMTSFASGKDELELYGLSFSLAVSSMLMLAALVVVVSMVFSQSSSPGLNDDNDRVSKALRVGVG